MKTIDITSLRNLRRKAGLCQTIVARALGKSQQWLSAVELGYIVVSRRRLFDGIAAIRTLTALKKASSAK